MLQFLKMQGGIQTSSSLSLPSLLLANILSSKLLFSWGWGECPNSASLNAAWLLEREASPLRMGSGAYVSVSLLCPTPSG